MIITEHRCSRALSRSRKEKWTFNAYINRSSHVGASRAWNCSELLASFATRESLAVFGAIGAMSGIIATILVFLLFPCLSKCIYRVGRISTIYQAKRKYGLKTTRQKLRTITLREWKERKKASRDNRTKQERKILRRSFEQTYYFPRGTTADKRERINACREIFPEHHRGSHLRANRREGRHCVPLRGGGGRSERKRAGDAEVATKESIVHRRCET